MSSLAERVDHLKDIQKLIDDLINDKDKIQSLVIGYEIDNGDKTKDTAYSYVGGINTTIGMLNRLANYLQNKEMLGEEY